MSFKRDYRGRFQREIGKKRNKKVTPSVTEDHNYVSGHMCIGKDCKSPNCPLSEQFSLGKNVSRDGWKEGRRIVEIGVLLENLKGCKYCRLGPVPLTYDSVVGELQRGLGGYLYVKCNNMDCQKVNIVPYGKTTREEKTKGIPCFDVNTKLGLGKLFS